MRLRQTHHPGRPAAPPSTWSPTSAAARNPPIPAHASGDQQFLASHPSRWTISASAMTTAGARCVACQPTMPRGSRSRPRPARPWSIEWKGQRPFPPAWSGYLTRRRTPSQARSRTRHLAGRPRGIVSSTASHLAIAQAAGVAARCPDGSRIRGASVAEPRRPAPAWDEEARGAARARCVSLLHRLGSNGAAAWLPVVRRLAALGEQRPLRNFDPRGRAVETGRHDAPNEGR
jgi:hypothetical protein